MSKSKGVLRTFDGLIFCFLSAVAIAIVALNIGQMTEPGKILPAGISMRSSEMSENIIRGIDIAIEDINLIRSGNAGSELWRLLTFVHLDPFFFLALLMPVAAAKNALLIGYYIRFGFCCAAMYYFMSSHLKLRRMFSVFLALMYTFSTQIVFTAQFSSLMNMAVMLPVVMSSFDSYLRKRTWGSFSAVCLSSLGLCATGGYGVMTGIPVVILTGLLMCISLYKRFRPAFTSWLKLLGGVLTGAAASMVFVIPGFASMTFKLKLSESFNNAKVNYKLFDMLRGSFLLRSGGLSVNSAPLFYIGILTGIAVIAFALNENIPVRVKVASGVIASVIHIFCCSSFVNETSSLFGTSPVLNASRLIGLEIIIFFVAGIGLKNAKSLSRGDLVAAGLIPLFFVIVANNSSNGTTLASPIVISTFLGVLVELAFVYGLSSGRIKGKARYAVLFFITIFVGINTAFIIFNNTIQSSGAAEYFRGELATKAADRVILDNDFEVPAVNSSDTYVVVRDDLSKRELSDSFMNELNDMSWAVSEQGLLEEIYISPENKEGIEMTGPDLYVLAEGTNVLTFEPVTVNAGERIFAYCSSTNGASLEVNAPGHDYVRVFTAPFLTEITPDIGEINLKFTVESASEGRCRIVLYQLNESAYDAVVAVSGKISGSKFQIDIRNMGGVCTVILPYAYDNTTRIRVNGKDSGSFSYCGKMATTFNADGKSILEISAERKSTGLVPGILISSVAAAWLIVIPVLQMYNKKKKVTGEGTTADA